jgi:hypothetical protein
MLLNGALLGCCGFIVNWGAAVVFELIALMTIGIVTFTLLYYSSDRFNVLVNALRGRNIIAVRCYWSGAYATWQAPFEIDDFGTAFAYRWPSRKGVCVQLNADGTLWGREGSWQLLARSRFPEEGVR